jgi:UDP-N-acetylglucosamine acyltransferase
MIGGLAGVAADVIPYGSVMGERAHLAGLNLVGLKRAKAERAQIHGLRAAVSEMFETGGVLQDRIREAQAKHAENPLVMEIIRFMTAESARSFTLPSG